jgi:hypothetical protein
VTHLSLHSRSRWVNLSFLDRAHWPSDFETLEKEA